VKKTWLIILLILFLLVLPSSSFVEAHPGRTDSSGGHTCRTNCESWGLGYGEYHYHGGGGSSSGGSVDNSFTAPIQEVVIYPTNTPIPPRIPTATPTRIPTRTPTPTITLAPSPSSSPTQIKQQAQREQFSQASAKATKPQGFFEWLLSLFSIWH
jgi:hypothetical protein